MNLITGATGIVGSHVALALLKAGKEVVATKQAGSDLSKVKQLFSYYEPDHEILFNRIKWIEVDIRDIFSIEDALEGINHVYHCAGFVSFNARDRKQLFEINEKGTRNLVNACLNKKTGALCHVSSLGTLNNLDQHAALDEKVFWKTSGKESDYAISKYNAEREVWRGMEEGLQAVIVNPGVIIGPGFWHQSSAKIFDTGYKGNVFYSTGSTGYVAAPDVARAMTELMEKRLFGNRYVLVENNYSFKEIFSRVNEGFKKPAPWIRANRLLLNLGRLFEFVLGLFGRKEKILSKAVINAAFNKQQYSGQRVITALGFKYTPVLDVLSNACKIYHKERQKQRSSI